MHQIVQNKILTQGLELKLTQGLELKLSLLRRTILAGQHFRVGSKKLHTYASTCSHYISIGVGVCKLMQIFYCINKNSINSSDVFDVVQKMLFKITKYKSLSLPWALPSKR